MCAHRLRDLLADPTVAAAHEQVAACERRGDELVRAIVNRLNTTFVTPFDLVARLASMREVQPHLDAVDRLESEGDAVHRRILARLFSGEFEALDVLRWQDVIESMERALNTLEDISDVVESIVLKHA